MIKEVTSNFRMVKKGEDDSNLNYFLSLSPVERFAHVELLRARYMDLMQLDESERRLQRVYRVIKRK